MTTTLEHESSGKRDFDFVFAVNGLPLAGSGGARIFVSLMNSLLNKGYKIGVVSLPREPWALVLSKGVATPWAQKLLLKLNDSPFTYHLFNPFFRFIIKSPSHFKINRGVKIMSGSDVNKYDCRMYIATNFISANQLVSIGIQRERIILFSQIDETDSLYSGKYADLALKTYENFSKRIFINEDVVKRFPGTKKIGMAIDLSLYRLLRPIDSRNHRNIVFITRTGDQKDPATAIEAINKINKAIPAVHISAYGNIDKSYLPAFVDYHPTPSDKEVVDILNSNSIFVTTSVLEGYPLPPLEAMACGCAVISTDSIGVKEYITNGVNGIICPVRNPDLIAKFVQQLMEDHQERIEIAMRGYKTAFEHSYEAMTENFLNAVIDFTK